MIGSGPGHQPERERGQRGARDACWATGLGLPAGREGEWAAEFAGPRGRGKGSGELGGLSWAAERGSRLRAKTGRERVSGPSGQIESREDFLFSKSFSILFSKPISIMNQMQIQIEFQIYFSTQIKMGNFGRLPKINFTTLLNSFIFQFSFSFISFTSKPFLISFSKAF